MRAYDPAGLEKARQELPDIEYCSNAYACARGADALVFVTEWAQFRALDRARLRREMAKPILIGLRNIYHLDDMARVGFTYESIGRRAIYIGLNPVTIE